MGYTEVKAVAITIDVETDWGGRLSVGPDNCQGIEEGIPYLLRLFDELKIRATFFVSGEVVTEYTDIIHDIVERGHEIASHGFKHNINYSMIPKKEIKAEISKSKRILEDEVGVTPTGFRAPQFRMNEAVYTVLHELNFKYDSSMVRGILPTRYNNLSIPSEPFIKNNLLEIPISAMPYLKVPMGLLWINAMGFNMFRFLLKGAESPNPIILYLHPFDLLQNKSKSDFGLLITRWYNYRSHSTKNTLELIIRYGNKEGWRFIMLKELL